MPDGRTREGANKRGRGSASETTFRFRFKGHQTRSQPPHEAHGRALRQSHGRKCETEACVPRPQAGTLPRPFQHRAAASGAEGPRLRLRLPPTAARVPLPSVCVCDERPGLPPCAGPRLFSRGRRSRVFGVGTTQPGRPRSVVHGPRTSGGCGCVYERVPGGPAIGLSGGRGPHGPAHQDARAGPRGRPWAGVFHGHRARRPLRVNKRSGNVSDPQFVRP